MQRDLRFLIYPKIILDYPNGLPVITRALKWKWEAEQLRPEKCEGRKTWSAIGDFEDGRGHEPRSVGSLWKSENARTQILPESLHKKHSPVDTLILAQWDLFWTSDLKDYKIINIWFS